MGKTAPKFWPHDAPARVREEHVEVKMTIALHDIQRTESVCEKRVADFVEWLQDGFIFDAVILRGHCTPFRVVNGNHRVEAHRRAGCRFIDAWIIPEVELFPNRWTVARHYEMDWQTVQRV